MTTKNILYDNNNLISRNDLLNISIKIETQWNKLTSSYKRPKDPKFNWKRDYNHARKFKNKTKTKTLLQNFITDFGDLISDTPDYSLNIEYFEL